MASYSQRGAARLTFASKLTFTSNQSASDFSSYELLYSNVLDTETMRRHQKESRYQQARDSGLNPIVGYSESTILNSKTDYQLD